MPAIRPLIIHPSGGTGGAENVIVEFASRLPPESAPVVVLMSGGELAGRLRALGVEVIVKDLPGRLALWRIPIVVRALARELAGREFSLVHANVTKSVLLGVPLARRLGLPLLWMKHGHDFNTIGPHLLGPRCAHVVCVSAAVAESFPKRMRDRVSVVYPGVELPPNPSAVGEEPVIVTAGTLIPVKGLETLLRAVAELRDRGIAARVEIAGGEHRSAPGYRAGLEALIRELRIEDRVSLLGWVADMDPVYSRARVVAMTSVSPRRGVPAEGAPLTLLEGMARRRPVVAPREGGIEVIVADAGTLVRGGSPSAYADAIALYLRDRELAQEVGDRGRERVRRGFTVERMVEELVACHVKVAGAGQASMPGAVPPA